MARSKNKIRDKVLLFILNPYLSGVTSFINIRDGISHKFLYLWFLIFGICFCAMNEAADSFRYVETFMVEHRYTWEQFQSEISDYFSFESEIKDIYTLTVNFLVGRFSSNYHWTYLIYSAIFGFFYIKSLTIFLKRNKVNNNLVFYALLFMFCYSNPIFHINGVRFWTSAWIGVYVALNIFVVKDYRKLLLLLLTPFIHITSFIWILILLITFLLSRFQSITIVLFILSSFVSAVSFLYVLDNFTYMLPQAMQAIIWAYTESEMALERMSGVSSYGAAYADFLIILPNYFHILLISLLIFERKKINKNEQNGNLLSILLALSTITNFLSGIPSMGRFKAMVIPFIIIVWAQNYNILKKYNKIFISLPLIYAYSLLYWFRNVTSVTEIYLYILPAPMSVLNYLTL